MAADFSESDKFRIVSESREGLDERFRDFVTKFLNELPKPFPERVRIGTIALVAEIERLEDAGAVETSEGLVPMLRSAALGTERPASRRDEGRGL